MNASLNHTDESFEEVDSWLRILHGTTLSVLLLASVTGNTLVLLLVGLNRSLQYRSVLCSLELVVADMLIAVAWATQGLGNVGTNKCPFGPTGCSILGIVTSIAVYARWCIVALITLERFCSIVCPFCYMKWSKPLLITLSIFCWAIPIALTTIPWLAGLGVYRFRLHYSSCAITCDPDDVTCFRFYISLYGIFVGVGGVLPMLLYFTMCVIGQRNSYKLRHIQLGRHSPRTDSSEDGKPGGGGGGGGDGSNDGSRDSSTTTTSTSPSSTSSSSILDRKILFTFFMIFMNVFLTQLPIYITSALRSNEETYDDIPLPLHLIFVNIYLLGSVLDPLLIMRNRDFKDVFQKIIRRRRSQGTSVSTALLDFVKLSSLLEVTPNAGSRRRRNSCPGTVLRRVPTTPPIAKARSYDGCMSWDREVSIPLDSISVHLALEGESSGGPKRSVGFRESGHLGQLREEAAEESKRERVTKATVSQLKEEAVEERVTKPTVSFVVEESGHLGQLKEEEQELSDVDER